MSSRGTVKRASMVPPRDIYSRAGCERNVEDDFLAGEIVRPLEDIPLLSPWMPSAYKTESVTEYIGVSAKRSG